MILLFKGFGTLCVQANEKWKALFRQCNQTLGVGADTDKLWENIAVAVSSSHQEAQVRIAIIIPIIKNIYIQNLSL